jgi:class 3 adenylate cyclase
MSRLKASDRAKLPDRAFAYIDSLGRRRLPIHDEAHVRNALARFERVAFEDDAAEERARKRLLNAAKRYGIVPVGFMTGQLRRNKARSTGAAGLPTGLLTFLLTDIQDSTSLLERLGERYAVVRDDVQGIIRRAVLAAGGREVDARADEFFAVFERATSAIEAAVAIQRVLGGRTWPDGHECRVRVGIHSGRPKLIDSGYVGLSVHTAARVSSAAHGGQIVVSGEAKRAIEGAVPAGIRLRALGRHRLRGLTRPEALFQIETEGLLAEFPPLRTEMASSAMQVADADPITSVSERA